jgi:succinate-semialdehyde dehydrogenase/glutarate-semialdehyde dehydrogenase
MGQERTTTLHHLPGYPEVPLRSWIGGTWTLSEEGDEVDVVDPATGEPFARVAAGGPAEARACVAAASAAGKAWRERAPRDRAEVLRRAYEIMVAESDLLADLIVAENGKARPEALAEVAYASDFFRWYSEEAVRLEGSLMTSPSGRHRVMTLMQPVGVCLLVTPWNFPAAMGTRKIGPALAAGCSVIVKPATETPLTMLAIADILHRAGVPDGVVNVVVARSSSEFVGEVLADSRVRKLSFTGSTEVGRILLATAAQRVVNCSMELGGNAPFVVFASADLKEAVAGALQAKMRNGGASCIAANRFLVEASVVDEFGRLLAAEMASLRMGPGSEPGVDLGPLVSRGERQHAVELTQTALAEGATLLTGGDVPERSGWYFPPTVLANVAPDASILREEVFGPIAPITSFASESDAVALASLGEMGLASYVYSGDLAQALRVAETIEAGMVGINRGFLSDVAAPFGGVKQSGLGREGGHAGLLEFCETKYVAVDW